MKAKLFSIQKRFRSWWYKKPRALRVVINILVLVLIIILVTVELAWYYRYTQRNKLVEYGVSFSIKYAQELGVDWKANYTALLEDLGFRKLRIMSYWDLHESENDIYNFADLDWQMDEAASHGAKVMLAVGLRQPRWPECHMPPWAAKLDKSERNDELYEYIATVVQRYSHHPALESYQLENEYFNRNFGVCDDHSRDRLTREMDIIRDIDPDHPIVISFADQLGMPLRGPHPDIYATSLYRGNYVKFIGYFGYPISSHFYGAKALLVRWLHGKEVVIHELQLEPWGPRATINLSEAEQNRFMSKDKIKSNMLFARRTGMKEIYLWGSEWWYWRKVHKNDPTVWETIREGLTRVEPVSSIVH